MVWVLRKFKMRQILSLSELVLFSSDWTRSFIKTRLSLRGFPQSILPSHLTRITAHTIFLAFFFLFPSYVRENESENEVFMKLFSALRIASREIIQQTFSISFMYGRKHFCHCTSSRKLQTAMYQWYSQIIKPLPILWTLVILRKCNRLIKLGTMKGQHMGILFKWQKERAYMKSLWTCANLCCGLPWLNETATRKWKKRTGTCSWHQRNPDAIKIMVTFPFYLDHRPGPFFTRLDFSVCRTHSFRILMLFSLANIQIPNMNVANSVQLGNLTIHWSLPLIWVFLSTGFITCIAK